MARDTVTVDHPAPYERAVCYYTLPKVNNPVTYGIIIAYTVCLFEAVAALVFGAVMENATWTRAGTFALVGIIVLGIAIFTARALINEVRQRQALAVAASVSKAPEPDDEDIPDPFEEHLLFRSPLVDRGTLFQCAEGEETPRYRVAKNGKGKWRITGPDENEVCQIQALGGVQSFLFDAWKPGRVNIFVGEERVGHLEGRFSFTKPAVDISVVFPEERHYVVRQQGIYFSHCLVGRIYTLRHSRYLDVNRHFFNESLLAYFIMAA